MVELIGWLISLALVTYLIFKYFKKFVKLMIFIILLTVFAGVYAVKRTYDFFVQQNEIENIDNPFKENVVRYVYIDYDPGNDSLFVRNDTTFIYRNIVKEFEDMGFIYYKEDSTFRPAEDTEVSLEDL